METNAALMDVIRLEGPCEIDEMRVSQLPVPQVKDGWMRVRVAAFGINESESHSRRGLSDPDFTYPRVLGIEGVGIVDEVAPGSAFQPGQQVAFMMGGLGREYDGSYARYTLIPERIAIPFTSDLDWATIGAIPEMTQTAYGSLVHAMRARSGDTILVRGGTSTVGLMAVRLGVRMGMTVIATTRRESARPVLNEAGAAHVVIDDGRIEGKVRALAPGGVDAALELVGIPVLGDTLRCVRPGGMVSFTGSLTDVWSMKDFSPFGLIPSTVGLTVYHGQAWDLPASVLQEVLDAVKAGEMSVPIAGVFSGLEQVPDAHRAMESHAVPGKNVVVLG